MLTRENQMLKQRIRELGEVAMTCTFGFLLTSLSERQVSELSLPSQSSGSNTGGDTHSPAQNSPLATTPATFSSESVPGITAEVDPSAKVD